METSPTPIAVLWGARLKAARLAADMTQVELADRIGASQHTISRLERGEHRPTDSKKIALARCFETTVEDLFPYAPFMEEATA
jgi:putative transcriptional regulator